MSSLNYTTRQSANSCKDLLTTPRPCVGLHVCRISCKTVLQVPSDVAQARSLQMLNRTPEFWALSWWKDPLQGNPISHSPPPKILTVNSSLLGWGATFRGHSSGQVVLTRDYASHQHPLNREPSAMLINTSFTTYRATLSG